MLTGIKELFAIAQKRGCAIPAFNVYNAEPAMGVFLAAEEARSCVIVQMYAAWIRARCAAARIAGAMNSAPSLMNRRLYI